MTSRSRLLRRARRVKLIAMDVDGVLTGGEIITIAGQEIKFWNAKDRLGLALIRDMKIPIVTAWITGRSSADVVAASQDLGITHLIQKCRYKKTALAELLKKHKLSFEDACFIGDDVIDLPVLKACGFSAAPADATPDVKRHVHYVSSVVGGRGSVREVVEFILKAQGKWESMVDYFLP